MKVCCLIFILISTLGSWFCQSDKINDDEKIIVVKKIENHKYNLSAIFYGVNFNFEDEKKSSTKIIKYIVFRDDQNGAEVRYSPIDSTTEQASDFYFTNVWSPDDELLILPRGKFEGFALIEAKDALNSIKENKYLDIIKVSQSEGGFYWHDFVKWEDNSIFGFRAGLDGDMFAFKYDGAKGELYCYSTKCEEFEVGYNKKGKIKAVKKGDIETITSH